MKTLFWFPLGLLFYLYFGYPALVAILARLRPRRVDQLQIHPMVSLVIVAHNEEDHIRRKIKNALGLDYPREQLEIVLASDGSDDHTVEIADEYAAQGVKVMAFAKRRGKPSVLNDVISRCTGQIIVFSDARQLYAPESLLALVRNFHDPSVGAVSGDLHLTNNLDVTVGEGVDFYWRYEKFIRLQESRFDSTVGATGAIYAIRRRLFEPLPADALLDDVTIPMRIARRGFRTVFEPAAKAFDIAAQTGGQEFTRKVRTITGNLQLFAQEPWVLSPRCNRLWFQTVSHKALRVLGPVLLALVFMVGAFLAGSSPLYRYLWNAQFSFYILAIAGHFLARVPGIGKWLSVPYAFCLLNLAAVVAAVRFLSGNHSVTWRRASASAGSGHVEAVKMGNPERTDEERAMTGPIEMGQTEDTRARREPIPLCGSWQSVLILSVIVSLVAWLYYPVLKHLAWQWWDDPNYSHGFLIPLLSGYFLWQRRGTLTRLSRTPALIGLIIVAGGVSLLLLGTLAAELFTMRVSLLVVLVGLVLSGFGWRHLGVVAFPIIYLLFMIPPPAILFNAIAFPLQLFAARTATWTLQLLDIPVLREGNLITLANTALEVADACSGIRSLVTLLAVATTLAYFSQRSFWRAAALILSAIPIAIVANASRVAGTGILAHYYGPKVAQGFFHTFSGWFLFLVATVLLGVVGSILARLPNSRRQSSRQEEAGDGQPTLLCTDTQGRETKTLAGTDSPEHPHPSGKAGKEGAWWRAATALAILAAGAAFSLLLSHGDAVPLRRSLERFPAQIGTWRGGASTLPPSILDVLRVTDYTMRFYTAPGKIPILLYVGYYETQRQGQTIHSPQQCLPGSGWNFLSREDLTIPFPGRSEPATINNVLVGKGEERQIVLYWYQERGRIVASEYQAKLYMIKDSIVRNRTDGALVRLSASVNRTDEETLQQLLEFARLMYPNLSEFLPG